MNGFIKEYLVDKGWKAVTNYKTNREVNGKVEKVGDCYPSTTLTHPYRNLNNAIRDFREACEAYDKEMGWRRETTKGKVVCAEVVDVKGYKAL